MPKNKSSRVPRGRRKQWRREKRTRKMSEGLPGSPRTVNQALGLQSFNWVCTRNVMGRTCGFANPAGAVICGKCHEESPSSD
jgi:hypothetical protein